MVILYNTIQYCAIPEYCTICIRVGRRVLRNMNKQFKRQNEFNKEKYYSPHLSLPIELKPIIQKKAKEYGNITQYFKALIDKDLSIGGGQNE